MPEPRYFSNIVEPIPVCLVTNLLKEKNNSPNNFIGGGACTGTNSGMRTAECVKLRMF